MASLFAFLPPTEYCLCFYLISYNNIIITDQHRINIRTLYSENFLGISKYEQQRQMQSDLRFDKNKLKYEIEMGDTESLLLSIKRAIYVVDKTVDHILLIKEGLQRIQRNPDLANRFQFGPVVMRMLHYFNMPDMALQVDSMA